VPDDLFAEIRGQIHVLKSPWVKIPRCRPIIGGGQDGAISSFPGMMDTYISFVESSRLLPTFGSAGLRSIRPDAVTRRHQLNVEQDRV
jgi:hypothetical protein